MVNLTNAWARLSILCRHVLSHRICLRFWFIWDFPLASILSCVMCHPLCDSSVLSLTPIQRRRCWVMTAACTLRSSCRSPCTRRPRTCRCASCLSGRMACWWPPPPKSQRIPCDWNWTEAASSSLWTLVSQFDSSWMPLLTFVLPSHSHPCFGV